MLRRRLPHLVVIFAALLPLAWLGVAASRGGLGANPIETISHTTGEWSLRLLLLTLAVTPARRLLSLPWLAPLRRTLGLLTFLYASLHMLAYVGLDQLFDWSSLVEDVFERRYVTAGLAAWLCMLPLALTSTRASMRRLRRRWVTLHRLVYVAAVAAIVHYVWLVKADLLPPLVHAALLALLLALRVRHRRAAVEHTTPVR
jgi:sulfoxide reductase heme-binding subunit YedZ